MIAWFPGVVVASVQELKDALLNEQTRVVEIADQAVSAIGILLSLSTWVIGILGFIIALLAIFGYTFIATSAKKAAQKVATSGFDSYIKSQEFEARVESAVRDEVRQRVKDKFILAHIQEEPTGSAETPFPSAEEAKRS